jgi:hypothetical protein
MAPRELVKGAIPALPSEKFHLDQSGTSVAWLT